MPATTQLRMRRRASLSPSPTSAIAWQPPPFRLPTPHCRVRCRHAQLVGDAGVVVPQTGFPADPQRAAVRLFTYPISYAAASRVGYYLIRDYRPVHIANQLLKVVA